MLSRAGTWSYACLMRSCAALRSFSGADATWKLCHACCYAACSWMYLVIPVKTLNLVYLELALNSVRLELGVP
jgi:hypothetical protein